MLGGSFVCRGIVFWEGRRCELGLAGGGLKWGRGEDG